MAYAVKNGIVKGQYSPGQTITLMPPHFGGVGVTNTVNRNFFTGTIVSGCKGNPVSEGGSTPPKSIHLQIAGPCPGPWRPRVAGPCFDSIERPLVKRERSSNRY